MSALYNVEPQPTAKVLLESSAGDILLELFAKQTPLASRNFLQLCLDGYYDNTIFHRLVPGFILQGGDPTGSGDGGEAIYDGGLFEDEFHSRLKFNRRGLLGMANTGKKNDNGSQFFFTLAATPELEGRNTMFGRVAGDTIYNLMKMGEAELLAEGSERPLYPSKIIRTEILVNPFEDMVKRDLVQTKKASLDTSSRVDTKKKGKKKGGKTLLSFGGDEAEDGSKEVVLKDKFNHQLIAAQPDPTSRPDKVVHTDPPNRKVQHQPKETNGASKAKPTQQPNLPRPISPPPHHPPPHSQLPLPNTESRSPSPSSEEHEHITKVSSLLDHTNAQIASLKASMKRTLPSPSMAEPPRKSALEQMIPATATRGRKRKHAGGNGGEASVKDVQSLELLKKFRAKLENAPAEREAKESPLKPQPGTTATTNGNIGQIKALNKEDDNNTDGDDDDEEASLCDLHFISHCQSCQSFSNNPNNPLNTNANNHSDDDDNDTAWMSHTLNFSKDHLGKDLTWKQRNGEDDGGLVVIDPREKARDIKEEERGKKRGKRGGAGGGGGREWDREREREGGKGRV
ncbi:MAG: hypothetical protein Q9220_005463 [cf. Caloplaca sp. 1 TL-2023]